MVLWIIAGSDTGGRKSWASGEWARQDAVILDEMSRVGGKKKLSRLNNPWRSVPSAAKNDPSGCACASLCVCYSGWVEKVQRPARREQKVRSTAGTQRTEKWVPVRDRTGWEMGREGVRFNQQEDWKDGGVNGWKQPVQCSVVVCLSKQLTSQIEFLL